MLYPEDIQGTEVCFLLTVEWMGMAYRFSTIPIDIQDLATNQIHRYNGGLSDPSIQQQTSFVGLSVDGQGVSIEVIFEGLDWVAEWLAGRTLANSKCELSMIGIKDGKTSYTEQDKEFLWAGRVVQPIIGSPDKPIGHVVFSIENNLNVTKVKLLDQSFKIDVYKFPNLDGLVDYPVGKMAPLCFGVSGLYPVRTLTGIEFKDKAHVSPAYTINTIGSGASIRIQYIIAMGRVAAGQARIYDQTGGNFRNPVLVAKNDDGYIYSYVEYQLGAVKEDNAFIPALDNDQTFFTSWGEFEGGLISPIDGQMMTGGLDLCMYVLDKVGLEYNQAKWEGLKTILNQYKFAGYVNDENVLAWDWLKENIIAHLPIEVINGEDGLEPVLNLYFQDDKVHPRFHILESGNFQIITGIQPLDQEIINKVVVSFGYEGEFDSYVASLSIDPTLTVENNLNTKDPVSSISYSRYGLHETVLELPFVWDLYTAHRIARDKIRLQGLGAHAIEIQAHPAYGYIQIGDIISFTSEKFGFNGHKCQVISKSWRGNSWNFVLHLESNTLVNPRVV